MTHRALIVSHGQPSDPRPAGEEIEDLARHVATHLDGWDVRAATLAEAGALERGLAGGVGVVYPLFMAAGWFTGTHLPRRLAAAGGAAWPVLAPFGADPAVMALTVDLARAAGRPVLLAGHGSFRSAEPSRVVHDLAARIEAETGKPCRAAFIDQSPQIADVARDMPNAACLPFFAARRGHVIDDLPDALARAGFTGPLLPPVGLHDRVPALIAAALMRARGA
ncbi:CbiX/SirB N-terminal domain-containing protein [Falsirhodobacter halotolerans]|uniref:CbiX/SirB N-terminal domain-containing protein n=1 Tax=Falsirhodobacter halotolerans TaxID=1146892 RepID=UPI001FD54656|nr:CbiX/SirB N-terminal domain-containing protein [Falsirhodobacter halotolerans]MCJ8138834.1 cobalamin biosynthesis protein CbiX [Falsirhodobacter halotolerans]